MRHVVWFSCGAASAMVAFFVLQKHKRAILAYCNTRGEHPDNKRFRADCEKWLGKGVRVLTNKHYTDHFDVMERTGWINSPQGAQCTVKLKKELRFKFQRVDDIQYFGYTIDEKHRADRFEESFPEVNAKFPLIEMGLTKENVVGMLDTLGIAIPEMYKMGYRNNNCIGCCKGGMGYWNKIRVDFPEHFKRMAEIERKVGATCLKEKIKGSEDSTPLYLDTLDPKRGDHKDLEISCDFVCQSVLNDNGVKVLLRL